MNMPNQFPVEFDEHPASELDRDPKLFTTPDVGLARQLFRNFQVAVGQVIEIPGTVTIPGIDISKWQVPTDMGPMVTAGWPFVVIKAGEALVMDPLFLTHLQAAIDAGALIMVYWFFRSNYSGLSQAAKCLEVLDNSPLKNYQHKTVVWCDVETADNTPNSTRITRVRQFLETIVAGGHEAGIYTSPYFWTQLMTPVPSWIGLYWQWAAHWTGISMPSLPTGWSFTKCLLWQFGIWNDFSWCPPVPGWQPDVDVNKAFGNSRQDLEAKFGITYVMPPDPDPDPDPEPGISYMETFVTEEGLIGFREVVKAIQIESPEGVVKIAKSGETLEIETSGRSYKLSGDQLVEF